VAVLTADSADAPLFAERRCMPKVFLLSVIAALGIPGSSYGQAVPTLEETGELIQSTVEHSEIASIGTRQTLPGGAKYTYEKFEVSGCYSGIITIFRRASATRLSM
jgi:hypothetical protein